MASVRKKKSTATAAAPRSAGVKITTITKGDDMPPRARRKQQSKYEEVVEAIQSLRKDDSVEIAPPEGVDAATLRNRMTYVLHRKVMPNAKQTRNGQTPKWRMYVSTNNTVVILRVA